MLKIAIGTMNPAKVKAVRNTFQFDNIEFLPINVSSGVSDQPFSDEETMRGAINRAISSRLEQQADIGIGLEGGVVEMPNGLFICNWGALSYGDNQIVVAGGAKLPLPNEVADGVRSGKELGIVMQEYTQKLDVRKNEGAVGIFTDGKINRSEMFTHILNLLIGQYSFAKKNSRR